MIKVDSASYSTLYAALLLIEHDNGGHLIGTVYPGEPRDLSAFAIPDEYAPLVGAAETALVRLRGQSQEDLETFVVGEQSAQDAIRERQGNLAEAERILHDYFNGWPAEDRPTQWPPAADADEAAE